MKKPEPAANLILASWQNGEVLPALDEGIKPITPEDGYAIQAEMARLRKEPMLGWKIAATAEAGRKHIQVDRPLAGRLFSSIVLEEEATVPFAFNRMRVAEAEIVLTLKSDLAPLEKPRSEDEVAVAVGTMHAGLEFPDSRFEDFTAVGTACLIADDACAGYFILGKATARPADLTQLAALSTSLRVNDEIVTTGFGKDALGGPLTALTWLVNTVNELGITVKAGEFVTTGVTGTPCAVQSGDQVEVHIESVGTIKASVSD